LGRARPRRLKIISEIAVHIEGKGAGEGFSPKQGKK